jgi:NACalpha-BTF3-like transcription factor
MEGIKNSPVSAKKMESVEVDIFDIKPVCLHYDPPHEFFCPRLAMTDENYCLRHIPQDRKRFPAHHPEEICSSDNPRHKADIEAVMQDTDCTILTAVAALRRYWGNPFLAIDAVNEKLELYYADESHSTKFTREDIECVSLIVDINKECAEVALERQHGNVDEAILDILNTTKPERARKFVVARTEKRRKKNGM